MYPYPQHNIDPSKKDGAWAMAYAKAAYYDWSYNFPKGVFANNNGEYEKFRMYALGKQPNSIYKKMLGVDDATNNTWLAVDWKIRAIVSGYRDKAISRMMKEDYRIVATPIDMLAKSETQDYYAEIKAKLIVREMLQQVNQELADHPLISLESGEPLDIEELEMRMIMGEQFNRSKDAEMAIELGFYENDYTFCRRAIYEDLFDYGVAGYKDWLGDDNKAKFRRVDPMNIVTSFCRKADFSDMVHCGEQLYIPLVELATVTDEDGNRVFTEEELQEFASSITGKYDNPTAIGRSNSWFKPYDKFRCAVFDIEFYTYNTYSYRYAPDENGNIDFRKADYGRGKKSDKYKRKTIQYVYKCKWIVGTDKYYDWGMAYDQKRSPNISKKAKTKLSYTLFAYNFFNMKAQSFMEKLIPYADEYQLTTLKIQNFKNRAVPSGWWINLDMLENVALNKGGANMQPKELLQMFFETGVLVGRSLDTAGNPIQGNVQPVIPIENTAASELAMFYQDLLNIVTTIEKIVGYNDITSGNPNPKTLVPGYQIANTSTNDALYPMSFAEEQLSLRLAEDVLCRMQQGIKKGGISGYARALSTNTLRFIELSPGIALREYGIELEKRTTDDQKMWLLQQMQADIQNGYLDSSDAVMLVNTHNAKQAQMIWAYRVKKAKELIQQNEMQKIQLNNQGATEAAKTAAQLEQQNMDLQWQYELRKEEMRIMGELKKEGMRLQAEVAIKQMELGVKDKMNIDLSDAKRDVAEVTAQAKIISSGISHESKIASAEISGEYDILKHKEANKKKPISGDKR